MRSISGTMCNYSLQWTKHFSVVLYQYAACIPVKSHCKHGSYLDYVQKSSFYDSQNRCIWQKNTNSPTKNRFNNTIISITVWSFKIHYFHLKRIMWLHNILTLKMALSTRNCRNVCRNHLFINNVKWIHVWLGVILC